MLKLRKWFFLLAFLEFVFLFGLTGAEVADLGYAPKGENPTLYDPAFDPIVQLDEATFNDTIFRAEREDCTAYLVEFYAEWCGHCRSYANVYKTVARDVRPWEDVVRIAAMNCGDPGNEKICKANGVTYFPFIKYFPRNSTNVDDGIELEVYETADLMRDQITQAVTYFNDCPSFEPLPQITTYGEMWNGVAEHVNNLAIIFEDSEKSLAGTQVLLDLRSLEDRIVGRRCTKEHFLAEVLQVVDYPSVAIFKRGDDQPVLLSELGCFLFSDLENYLESQGDVPEISSRKSSTSFQDLPTAESIDCGLDPEGCRSQFYVSESDMLKAIRYAIYCEVSRSTEDLSGQKLTALYNFIDLLANHFPDITVDSSGAGGLLSASCRARAVFIHMRDFLAQRGLYDSLSVEQWKEEFVKSEADQGKPFPIGADWQHCKGSSSQFRGYTCGLWMSFHALTVRSYLNSFDEPNFKPAEILFAIRDWVNSFFGCEHCRNHFIEMTTETFKIEDNVHAPQDVYLYLWEAHNIVNARLKGQDTEDPKFPKLEFPAQFLCDECQFGEWKGNTNWPIQEYLVNYYSNIRPIIDSTEE